MESIIIAVHVFVSIALILIVLLQSGKGADMGASFGGASQTAYGSGGGNIMTRLTTGAAITWMTTSLVLALMSAQSGSIFDDAAEPAALVPTAPVASTEDAGNRLAVGRDGEGLVVNVQPTAAAPAAVAEAPAAEAAAVPAAVAEAVEAAEAAAVDAVAPAADAIDAVEAAEPAAEEAAPADAAPAAEEAPAAP